MNSHDPIHMPLNVGRPQGDWLVPAHPRGVVIFAHGSGSSRWSPRNRRVAAGLRDAGFATLLFDMLTPEEDVDPAARFDIHLLTQRLVAATRWTEQQPEAHGLVIGYFGASTGAAAALEAAAMLPNTVGAVVSRGGRPDLASSSLPRVHAATLLIVGGKDHHVLALNRQAAMRLRCPYRLAIVEGAGHLFEERGTLDEVLDLAAAWFERHLTAVHPVP